MAQNTFTPPRKPFSRQSDGGNSTLHRLKEIIGIGRREQMIIIGVTVLAVVAGVLFFFRPPAETPPEAVFSPLEQHAGAIEVTFSGSYDVPIERTPLFIATEYLDQNTVLSAFAQRLNMQVSPQSLRGNTYIDEAGEHILSMAGGNQGIIFSSTFSLPEDIPTANLEPARVVAGDFLERIGYTPSEFTLLEEKTQYLGTETPGSDELEEVSPEQAVIIRLFYEKRLEGLPLTYGASAIEEATLDISSQGLYRATLPNTFLTTEERNTYSVISVEKALENISEGQFTIIGTTARVQKENDYIRLDLESQKLQYRFDETSQIVFPVFQFTGTAITESYQDVPITVVTEAITVQDINTGSDEPAPQNTSYPEP